MTTDREARAAEPDAGGIPVQVPVRLLFVDGGSYHQETVSIPGDVLERYDRLIDCLREDPAVLKALYVDVARLAGAWRIGEPG